MTHIRPAVKPSLTDFGELRPAGPRAVREAADAGEVIVDDAGVAVLFGDDLERRLAGLPDATQQKAIPAASLLGAVIAERIKNALARLLEKFRR